MAFCVSSTRTDICESVRSQGVYERTQLMAGVGKMVRVRGGMKTQLKVPQEQTRLECARGPRWANSYTNGVLEREPTWIEIKNNI